MDSVTRKTLTELGQTLIQTDKQYKHWLPGDVEVKLGSNPLVNPTLGELQSGDKRLKSNATGLIPLVLWTRFQDTEETIDLSKLNQEFLPSLNSKQLSWINQAKTAKMAGIACLYLVWRGDTPEDYPSKPAMARKKAREALQL